MDHENYKVDSTTSFGIDIAPAPKDGKKYPVVVVIHGNAGLGPIFGDQLREFTKSIATLGYVAALPTYYAGGEGNLKDMNIDSHLPAISAAITHLSNRTDADITRLGLVGFSLGGGIAMAYINSNKPGSVKVFADFYGFVVPKLGDGVAKFPPTITFSNNDDDVVDPDLNTRPLLTELKKAKIDNDEKWYDDNWELSGNHAFKPGGTADVESRDLTNKWLSKYMPPVGR